MSASMSTRAGEVRVLTLVDVSLDPYDRRNGLPKPGRFDFATYGDVPGRLYDEIHDIAVEGLGDGTHHCNDCDRVVGYQRVEGDEGAWEWLPLFILASSKHTSYLCADCGDGVLPEVIQ